MCCTLNGGIKAVVRKNKSSQVRHVFINLDKSSIAPHKLSNNRFRCSFSLAIKFYAYLQ